MEGYEKMYVIEREDGRVYLSKWRLSLAKKFVWVKRR